MVWVEIVAMSCTFFFARTIRNKFWITGGLAATGTLQSLYVILQLCGIARSNHELFEITGFLGNPGQLGGFQAVSFVAVLTLYAQWHSRINKILIILSSLLIFFSLILSGSRAGLLAAIAGVISLTYKSWSTKMKRSKWIYVFIPCLTFMLIYLLYIYSPESANARLHIWRVCADLFMDKPLLGFGYRGFNMNYMLYQGEYFSLRTDTDFSAIADNVVYPYNEFIHILVEQGITGFVLFVLMIYIGIRESRFHLRLYSPLIAFLTFSTFSYPSYKLALGIILPLLIGILPTRPLIHTTKVRTATATVSLIALILCIIGISYSRHKFYGAIADLYNRVETESIHKYVNDFFIYNHYDLKVNALYATYTEKFPEMLNDDTIPRLFPSSDTWCTIGRHYMMLHEYDKAQEYFCQAANMVPGLIQPKYLLWKAYILQGNEKDALKIAETISRMRVKVENTYTLRIRNEVIKYHLNQEQ